MHLDAQKSAGTGEFSPLTPDFYPAYGDDEKYYRWGVSVGDSLRVNIYAEGQVLFILSCFLSSPVHN